MNKFQKIFLLCCLFSYVFSLKVTNIEPKTATLGESVDFNLTVQDYDSTKSYRFYLANDGDKSKIELYFSTSSGSSTTLKYTADIRLYDKEDLNNLKKTLFLDNENTNLAVTIEKPKSLKLLNFYSNQFYSYGVSKLEFLVNFNELYKSDFSIKFGEFSITNCSLEEDSIRYINCYYAFPESLNEKTLKLKFGNEDTNYSITINAPKEFSSIDELNKEDLNNHTKTLFLNHENTNLAVTIEKPINLKLLYFYEDSYYSYGVSSFEFRVNLNELYKSDFSIKFGDLSITNCSLDEDSIRYIYCYYEFPESSAGKTLKLNFDGKDTDYSITIKDP